MLTAILLVAAIAIIAYAKPLMCWLKPASKASDPQTVQPASSQVEDQPLRVDSWAKRLSAGNNRKSTSGRKWQYIVMPSGRTRRIHHVNA